MQGVCRGEWVGVFVKAIKDTKLEAFSDSVDIAIARPASALLQPLPRTPSAETCCSMMWWQQLNSVACICVIKPAQCIASLI